MLQTLQCRVAGRRCVVRIFSPRYYFVVFGGSVSVFIVWNNFPIGYCNPWDFPDYKHRSRGNGLFLFLPNLLAITLARKRLLHAFLLTWLQVERVAFDLLDDVFGLHLALETAQSVLKGFAFLNSNFCQWK